VPLLWLLKALPILDPYALNLDRRKPSTCLQCLNITLDCDTGHILTWVNIIITDDLRKL